MIVTDLTAVNGKPGIYFISVDGKPIGKIAAEDIFKFGLVVNKSISETTYLELVGRVEYLLHYYQALSYASRRLRSKEELKRYLVKRKCIGVVADSIIDELDRLGIIDEQKLVEAYIHDSEFSSPMSKKMLILKLKQKKIDQQTIDNELIKNDYDDTDALDALIAKKANLTAYKKNKNKFFRYLISRGFKYEDIAKRIGRPENN